MLFRSFPLLKKFLPEVDKQALSGYERLEGEGNKLILEATNGKLGGGVTDNDVRLLRSTTFDPSRTREYNLGVLRKYEALQNKVIAAQKEAENYVKDHGGLDSNFQTHMSKWGQEHPVQSFMRKEAEHQAGQIGGQEPVSSDKASPMDMLKQKYPHMSEDQMRQLYQKMKSGAQ